MADWRRNSIAGGPSPSKGSHGALHLDFFHRPSAAGVAFPCDGAGGTTELEAAIGPTPRPTKAIADEPYALPAADGDTRISVASPVTLAPPLQQRQCPPDRTASTREGGQRRHASRNRVSCPSSSQLPPIPENVADSFDNNEIGEDECGMSPGCSEEDDEDTVLYAHNGGDEEASRSGRSEEGDEALPSGRDEEDDEATSSGSDEVEDGDEAMSSRRREDEEQDEEDMSESEEEEEDECWYCGSMEELVMLLPCRHGCYCRDCFNESAGLQCPVPDCGDNIKRAHDLSGRLAKRR